VYRPAIPSNAVFGAIDKVATGEYAGFAGHLVGEDDSRIGVVAEALLDADMRARIEARFAKRFDTFDPRAVHSIWMKWYLNLFLPPVLLADVLLKQSVPVELETTRFIIGEDTRVAAVRLGGDSQNSEGVDPFERFSSLIFRHFAPLIEMWSMRTEVTSRVFWSNVGNTFEAMLRKVETVSGPSERLTQAQRLLDESQWDGAPNPLFGAVYYVEEAGEPVRRRRVCCIQYLLPDRRFCKACPIEEARMVPVREAGTR
jgi:ferric iron reductase protein FhuF